MVVAGGQTGNEARPIQLIKASSASLISSGRHLQSQERTAGRLKAERRGGEETRDIDPKGERIKCNRSIGAHLCHPFIRQMH